MRRLSKRLVGRTMLPVGTPKNATQEIVMGLTGGLSIVNLAGALIRTVLFSQTITAWKVAAVTLILGIGIGLLVSIATITKTNQVQQILTVREIWRHNTISQSLEQFLAQCSKGAMKKQIFVVPCCPFLAQQSPKRQ